MWTDALLAPGAVDDASRPGVPEHYGRPAHEQRALHGGRAVVLLPDHGVVALEGPDRLRLLDSLTTQALAGLVPGESAETLLLDPNGRIEQVLRVLDDGSTAWLLVDAGRAASVASFFDRMRFMLQVEVRDESEEFVTAAALDGGGADRAPAAELLAASAAAPAGVPLVWRDPWGAVRPGGWQYALEFPAAGTEWGYAEALVPRAAAADLLATLTAGDATVRPAGIAALTALRIEAHRPGATELDERAIPHEFDWLRSAVHLNKGCYRGQETVAKVHNLGHPPRRLVTLHLDGSVDRLPEAGEPVWSVRDGDRRKVGLVTAAARHHELGPIAFALLKRSVPVEEALLVLPEDAPAGTSEVAAAQEVIVPPSAGAAADVPRLPRLG